MSLSDREWLREQGFTVGERGRFSKEMLDALATRNSETVNDERVTAVEAAGLDAKIAAVPLREPRELHGRDEDGHDIGFILCSKCHKHMIWCKCADGVHAPSIVVSSDDPLVVTRGALVH